MRKALRRELRMSDRDLIEILDTPEIAVHADSAEVEARNPQRLAADLSVPTIGAEPGGLLKPRGGAMAGASQIIARQRR
ncbi:hypothetical protein ABIB82_006554 [Bradyrhizobium sp. i1.8.4]